MGVCVDCVVGVVYVVVWFECEFVNLMMLEFWCVFVDVLIVFENDVMVCVMCV